MTDAIYKLSRDFKISKRRWFGVCREYAALFRQIPEWRTTFWKGVRELIQSGQLTRIGDLSTLLENSLERLGFWQGADDKQMRVKFQKSSSGSD